MIKIYSPLLGMSPLAKLGGEVHDYNLIKYLCLKNNKVEVLLPKGAKYEPQPNLKVNYLPINHIFPPHLFNILVIPYIFKKCLKKDMDILRIHTPYFLGFAALFVKTFFPTTKIVTTIHLKEERFDLHWILKMTIGSYDHIFTVSKYLKNWLINSYNFDPNKITVIYNGVEGILKPANKDKQLVKKYKVAGKVVLLTIGSLISRKNILFLIDLFEKVLQKKKNVSLVICGKGYLKKQIKKTISGKNIKNITLIDSAYGQSKAKLINLTDIFLFPSLNEGFGLVAVEALACGIPVIASDNTSLPEIINNRKNGLLAKTSNLNDWLNKCLMLINDSSYRKRLGRNGRKDLNKNFSWDVVTEKTLKVLEKL